MSDQDFTFDKLLLQARQLAAELEQNLPSRVDPATITLKSKLPFKAIALREILIHRSSELASVACSLFEEKRVVSAYIITRSLLETTAILFWLYQRVDEVVKANQVGDIDDFLMKALHGTRNPNLTITSYNILTAIDRVAKKFVNFREMYDELCEYAHPNWYGMHGAYGRIDFENHWLDLGADVAEVPVESGLSHLLSTLDIFKYYYNGIADLLPDFVRICDEDLDTAAA